MKFGIVDPIVTFRICVKVMFSQNLWIKQWIRLRNDDIRVVKEVIYQKSKYPFITYCSHDRFLEL